MQWLFKSDSVESLNNAISFQVRGNKYMLFAQPNPGRKFNLDDI